METIIGIDLGTTNSEVAIIRDGQPVVLPDEDGDPILPSVVGLDPQGRLLVGQAARNQFVLAPERTIRSIKRKMGEESTVTLGDKQVLAAGDLGDHPPDAQAARREGAGRAGQEGGDHRPGLLQRGPAPGDPRGGRAGRPGGRPDHQRADRRRADLRPAPARAGAAAGLRPRRRHLRRLDRPGRGGRRRDPRQPRRHPPRRRRLRPAAPRLRLRSIPEEARRRPPRRARRPEPRSSAPSRRPRSGSPSRPSP